MLFSGLHLGWGIFNINFDSDSKLITLFGMNDIIFWMVWLVISWFASASFGLYIGAKLVEKIKKIKIYVSLFISKA